MENKLYNAIVEKCVIIPSVHGYCVFQDVWKPVIGENLNLLLKKGFDNSIGQISHLSAWA